MDSSLPCTDGSDDHLGDPIYPNMACSPRNSSSTKVLTVGIIGAGIGGLILAQLLSEVEGVRVLVFERDKSSDSRFQGWYLGLSSETLDRLEPLFQKKSELKSDIFVGSAGSSRPVSSSLSTSHYNVFNIFNSSGTAVMRQNVSGFFVDRRLFRSALLRDIEVHWNHRFVGFTSRPDKVTAIFSTSRSFQHEVDVDILVGADGANSALRPQLCPQIQYKGLKYISVGGVCPITTVYEALHGEALEGSSQNRWLGLGGHSMLMLEYVENSRYSPEGPGRESQKVIFWMLSFPGHIDEWANKYSHSSESLRDEHTESFHFRNELLEACVERVKGKFPEVVLKVVQATEPSRRLFGPRQLFSVQAEDLRGLLSSPDPRVVLLGDAAHATTTHRSVGANSAIGDALDLATIVEDLASELQSSGLASPMHKRIAIATKLKQYNLALYKRGFQVVKDTLHAVEVIHSTGFWAWWRLTWLRVTSCVSDAQSDCCDKITESVN